MTPRRPCRTATRSRFRYNAGLDRVDVWGWKPVNRKMTFIRWHRGLIGQIAAAAMLLHVLAGALCPLAGSHSSSKGYVDSVLGWVTLCLPSQQSADSGTSGTSKPVSDSHDRCAAVCAAAVHAVAVAASLILLALLIPFADTASRFLKAPRSAPYAARIRNAWSLRDPPISI